MPKVLIAEDDVMIADMMEDVLVDGGYEVCGIARTVSEAVRIGLQLKPDMAVIDLRLAENGCGTEIAAQLGSIGRLGVLYASGNAGQIILTAADGDAVLIKPYRAEDLLRSLQLVTEIVATGSATPPFPRGFQVLPAASSAAMEQSNE